MWYALSFAVSLLVFRVDGKSLEKGHSQTAESTELPCHFGSYDVNGDMEISMEEFLTVTSGFTKMDPKALFERLDTNGDQKIEPSEFSHVDPSLIQTGILDHCKRLRCKFLCFYTLW